MERIRERTWAVAGGRSSGGRCRAFRKYLGMSDAQVEGMRRAPMWATFEAIAPTLAYDHIALMGHPRCPLSGPPMYVRLLW